MSNLSTDEELVQRLDELAAKNVQALNCGGAAWALEDMTQWQAARRLESLLAERERLREALDGMLAACDMPTHPEDIAAFDRGYAALHGTLTAEYPKVVGTQVESLSKPSKCCVRSPECEHDPDVTASPISQEGSIAPAALSEEGGTG